VLDSLKLSVPYSSCGCIVEVSREILVHGSFTSER
jgi:hypothetical protein